MLQKAKEIIRDTLSPNHRVLVGLSGGADSVALTHLLYTLGYRLVIVHINFHLRGAESDRDQAFVTQWVQKELPEATFLALDVETKAKARESGISIEMAARELRYRAFEKVAHREHCQWIAVGHHADDQIETALLNLGRGTGGKGMAGMRITSRHIFRPFLTTWRSELMGYIREHNLAYVNDSTNSDTEIKRNYVRHKLIPALQEINPAIKETLLQTTHHFREEQDLLEQGLLDFKKKHFDPTEATLRLKETVGLKETRYYLFRWLSEYGFTSTQTDNILASHNAKKTIEFTSPTTHIQIYQGKLYFMAFPPSFEPIPLVDKVNLPEIGIFSLTESSDRFVQLHERYRHRSLTLRMGDKQDRFTPYGMKHGSKSLFRFLGEKGVPQGYRPFCPVVECDNEIIAVLPFEVSEHAKYDDRRKTLKIGFTPHPSPQGQLLSNLLR